MQLRRRRAFRPAPVRNRPARTPAKVWAVPSARRYEAFAPAKAAAAAIARPARGWLPPRRESPSADSAERTRTNRHRAMNPVLVAGRLQPALRRALPAAPRDEHQPLAVPP